MNSSDELLAAYRAHTKRSRELSAQARRRFPGGDTRASAHYTPYPVFIEEASGCRMVDADGHEYLDMMNNFTSLIHGHGHAGVVAAVREQVGRGSAYAAPTRSQIALADLLCERVASVDRLRFASAGSEATLMAIRAARAVSGRQKVLKFEGGYHGSYDLAEVSLVPLPGERGPLTAPRPLAIDRSIAASALDDVVVAPFNEPAIAAELVARHAGQLACAIVEPIQASMGMIPATPDFLAALRDATRAHDVLLVLDEVVSLRLASGGAQQRYDVAPDLTAMGKIIGGGLPIGAFGGRAELIDVFDPDAEATIFHASTFSGNALSMAAGRAALTALHQTDFDRLDALGERLRRGIDRAFLEARIPGQATGVGSLAQWILTRRPLRGPRDVLDALARAGHITNQLHLALLRRGIFGSPRGMWCLSTPMRESDVDRAVDALRDALLELRPIIERERPALLDDGRNAH